MKKTIILFRTGVCLVTACIFFIGGNISCRQHAKSTIDSTEISLCRLYEDQFTIGVALSDKDLKDSVTTSIVKKHFNSVTAENAMKWEHIHPGPGIYDFDAADRLVRFGEENNMEIIGHVLIWHQQTPDWVFKDQTGKQVSRDTLISRMRNHINTVVGRYRGRIHCWDVVNEAVGDNAEIRENIWFKIIGIDYIELAFRFAAEADPEAILIYNDYSLPSPEKRLAVVNLVEGLKEKGVKIDAIGMQGHYHLDYPELSDLEQSIVAFGEIGCQVMFTELDINVLPYQDLGADISLRYDYDEKLNPFPREFPDTMQTILADRYVSFFKIFKAQKDIISRVTIWGVQDGTSWLNYWPVRGRTNHPLLFDRNYKPKKAFWAVAGLMIDEYQHKKEP